MNSLPIDEHLDAIQNALESHYAVVVEAETGAGKTTRVPPALLDGGVAGSRAIAVLEPRRIAARVAAHRMATERQCRIGDEIGYQVRFDRKAGRNTRILVMTEGVFLRTMQQDPFLDDYGVVVLDEFHERAIETDLALAFLRQVQSDVRPDLRIVVMSATLDTQTLSRYLDDCPVISSRGRSYPIEVEHIPRIDDRPIPDQVADGIRHIQKRTQGDLLAFLPGVREIQRTHDLLRRDSCEVFELYGAMSAEAQDAVLTPRNHGERRVILATNVAETSITVPGISGVVDAGYMRTPQIDPNTGLEQLATIRVSKASAAQRAGRAGRLGPGFALRLWTSREHDALHDHAIAEIHRADLARPCLELLSWGERDLLSFTWFDAPAADKVQAALEVLKRIGAVRDGQITEVGRGLCRLPLQPRLGRLVLASRERGAGERGAWLAALLSDRLPRTDRATHESDSDLLDVLDRFIEQPHHPRRRWIQRMQQQIARASRGTPEGPPAASTDDAVREALLIAFPDRLAVRRPTDRARATMVGGRGVELSSASAVRSGDYFLVHELSGQQRRDRSDAVVLRATRVEADWVLRDARKQAVLRFDESREKVESVQQLSYSGLILREDPCALEDSVAASALLATHAATSLERALPLDTESTRRLLTRLACLNEWLPELQLPVWDDERFRGLLPTLCAGKRSFVELHKVPLNDFILGELDANQRAALDRDAPEHFRVPSGSRIRIQYEVGRPPILAVRIQELYGLHETPTVARGKVPMLLHLLAPNGRPQQVTSDLESFWKNTYPEVRKDLRVRYSKHAWPEDPWTATAERRPQRKRRK